MKEMDDIEQLFASSFKEAKVTPPVEVKSAIDKTLFGNNNFVGLRLIYLLIIALFVGLGIFFIPDWSPANGNQRLDLAKYNESNQMMNVDVNHQSQNTYNGLKNEGVANDTANPSKNEVSIDPGQNLNLSDNFSEATSNSSLSMLEVTDDTKKAKETSVSSSSSSSSSSIDALSNKNKELDKQLINSELNNSMTSSKESDVLENFNTEIGGLQTKKVKLFSSQPNGLIKGNYPTLPIKPIASGLSLSLYSGVTAASNQLNSTVNTLTAVNLSMKEINGYNVALEASLPVFGQFGLAGGIEYSTRNDLLINTISEPDSSFISAGWEYVYLTPGTQDTIIDSNYVETYDMFVNSIDNESVIKSVSISIPVYFTYEKALGSHLSLMVSAGARFSYLNLKTVSENILVPTPNYSKFGLSLLLRPELRYDFNRFGIGLYGTTGYNAVTGMNWETHNRHRYEFGGGLVLRFKL